MNDSELEAIVLSTCLDIIEDLLSRSIVTFYPDPNGVISEVKPHNSLEKRLFSILLVDLITPLDNRVIGKPVPSTIEYLKLIGQSPLLGNRTNGKRILSTAVAFDRWLKKEFTYRIDSALGKKFKLTVSRRDMIRCCGNKKKHSVLKLGIIANQLKAIYEKHGQTLAANEHLAILDDIENWFYDDALSYHFTTICEHLNNIYSSIIRYIEPIYKKRFIMLDDVRYKYSMPVGMQDAFAQYHYYSLLNRIWHRKNETLVIIKTSRSLKSRL
jgi:hypothetical protein